MSDMFFAKDYNNPDQCTGCMSSIYEFYKSGQFIDASFNIGDSRFNVHKNVMAANSEYFYEMFNDDNKEYELPELAESDPDAMDEIIKYCYTGELSINPENVSSILNLASILKMDSLIKEITIEDNEFAR